MLYWIYLLPIAKILYKQSKCVCKHKKKRPYQPGDCTQTLNEEQDSRETGGNGEMRDERAQTVFKLCEALTRPAF